MSERKNTDAVCVCVCLRAFTGQAVGGDTWQRLSANVAEGRSGVRAGVPVVHPGEMLHIKLTGLGGWEGETLRLKRVSTSLHKRKHKRTKTRTFPELQLKKITRLG